MEDQKDERAEAGRCSAAMREHIAMQFLDRHDGDDPVDVFKTDDFRRNKLRLYATGQEQDDPPDVFKTDSFRRNKLRLYAAI